MSVNVTFVLASGEQLEDGSPLELLAGGAVIARAAVQGGAARFDADPPAGAALAVRAADGPRPS